MRVLLLGFSCTELGDGYTKTLMPSLQQALPGVEIFRCGLGGLTPPTIPFFLQRLQETKGPFTHVVLEISTSSYQWLAGVEASSTRDVLLDTLQLCRDSQVQPIFLMLYRKAHKKPTILLNDIIRSVSSETNTPCIDLAEGFSDKYGHEFAQSLLRDVVHTNATGGALQADLALWRLVYWLRMPPEPPLLPVKPRFRRIPISADTLAPARFTRGTFSRRDLQQTYVEVPEGEVLTLDLGQPRQVMGVSYAMGPTTGYFSMSIDGGAADPIVVPGFDQRCYYPRMGFRQFNTYKGRKIQSLTLQVVPGHEDIVLLKGERPPGAACLQIVDIVEMLSAPGGAQDTGQPEARGQSRLSHKVKL